jgi:hypothetical protein
MSKTALQRPLLEMSQRPKMKEPNVAPQGSFYICNPHLRHEALQRVFLIKGLARKAQQQIKSIQGSSS